MMITLVCVWTVLCGLTRVCAGPMGDLSDDAPVPKRPKPVSSKASLFSRIPGPFSDLPLEERQVFNRLYQRAKPPQTMQGALLLDNLFEFVDSGLETGNLTASEHSRFRVNDDTILAPEAIRFVEKVALINGSSLRPGQRIEKRGNALAVRVEKVDRMSVNKTFTIRTVSGSYNGYCELQRNNHDTAISSFSSRTDVVVTGLQTLVDRHVLPKVFEKRDFFMDQNSTYNITSVLFGFAIFPPQQRLFLQTYKIVLTHNQPVLKSNSYTVHPACVFWNHSLSAQTGGAWSDRGCVVLSFNMTSTQCQCDHLTSFAILMKYTPHAEPALNYGLSLVTYLGVTVSIIALLLTLAIFIYLGSLTSERTMMHKHLATSLVIAQLIFVSGINLTGDTRTCQMIAVLLHYFYLVGFAWMLCEGIHLYTKVIWVFTGAHNLVPIYYAIGWGAPALIVGITAAVNFAGYGGVETCWLSVDNGHIWAFIGPVIAVCVVNLFVLVRCIIVLLSAVASQPALRHHPNISQITTRAQACSAVKGVAILTPLLGVSWLFGLLTATKAELVFEYIFTVLNAFQGLFIFLFHCLGSSEVRSAIQRKSESNFTSRNFTLNSSSVAPAKK